MKERLTQFLQSEQLSPARFADILGVQRSGISHILSGRNKPGFDLIEKIVTKFPDINAEWLITGKGNVYKDLKTELNPFAKTESKPESKPERETEVTAQLFNEITSVKQPPAPVEIDKRTVSKIFILYSDKSFGEYHPE